MIIIKCNIPDMLNEKIFFISYGVGVDRDGLAIAPPPFFIFSERPRSQPYCRAAARHLLLYRAQVRLFRRKLDNPKHCAFAKRHPSADSGGGAK